MIVLAVVCALVFVACSGADTADRAAGRPDDDDGYGTAPTTTTVPAASETAVDGTLIAEKVGVETRFERASVNGEVYPNALVMEPLPYRTEWRLEIGVGRDYTRFRGDLGITDDQPSASFHRVEIVLDNGSPVLSAEVRFGETKTIDLDVTNVLRIRIVLTPNGYSTIAIGNPRLVR